MENCIFSLFSELETEQRLDIAVPEVTMIFDVKGEGKQDISYWCTLQMAEDLSPNPSLSKESMHSVSSL